MKIYTSEEKTSELFTLEEWKLFFQKKDSSGKKHWKNGRSAWAIANFMMNQNGEQGIKDMLSVIDSDSSIIFDYAIPEYKVHFDAFAGNTRNHDLAIWGKFGEKPLFVGIEAKVDEEFDSRSIEEARNSGSSPNSKLPLRVESLTKRINFKGGYNKTQHGKLKYQLFYSTIGTAYEMKETENAISVFLVLVFKTAVTYDDGTISYDENKAKNNYKDYSDFMNACTYQELLPDRDVRLLEIYMDDSCKEKKTMYSVYEYIDAIEW